MAFVGWAEFIFLVAIFVFLGIIYWVYWVRKRKLAVGLVFLVGGSAFYLFFGIGFFVALWDSWVVKGRIPPLDLPNILLSVLILSLTVSAIGFAIYGLLSAYRSFRMYLKLRKCQKVS